MCSIKIDYNYRKAGEGVYKVVYMKDGASLTKEGNITSIGSEEDQSFLVNFDDSGAYEITSIMLDFNGTSDSENYTNKSFNIRDCSNLPTEFIKSYDTSSSSITINSVLKDIELTNCITKVENWAVTPLVEITENGEQITLTGLETNRSYTLERQIVYGCGDIVEEVHTITVTPELPSITNLTVGCCMLPS